MKKAKLLTLIIVASLPLTLTGCINPKVESIRNDPEVYAPSTTPVATALIRIKNGKFSPPAIKIQAGSLVTFLNLDNTRHLVISDPHPEHNQLPNLYSQWLTQNDSYQYRFEKPGKFGIHLEDNPSVSATIIVAPDT